MEDDAPEAGTNVDQRGALGCQRDGIEQPIDIGDRRRLVVGREGDARPDRLGVEFAQEDQRFGRDPVRGIEALAGPPAQWTSALASVS